MKHLKQILVATLTMFVAFALAIPAFAADIIVQSGTQAADGTESQDVLKNETYNAYKILNYTSDTTQNPAAYSYYLTAAQYDKDNANGLGKLLESVGFEFTPSADGSQYVLTNGNEITDAADVANALYAIKDKIAAVAIADAEATATADKQAVFSGLDTGYWFVTSSLGALCSLQSYDDQALIVEKNTMVTDKKEVDADSKNVQIGDVLTYTITLTDGDGTNLAATITDTMSKGLTYNDNATVKINGQDSTAFTKNITNNADGTTTVVYTFSAETMTALQAGQTIVVTYTATVNSDASLDGTETNTEVTRYSNQENPGKPVNVKLTNMTVNKKDGTNALKGAQFKLFRTDSALNLDHVAVMLRQLTDEELTAANITKAVNTVYYTVDKDATTDLIDMAQKNGNDYLYSSAVVYGLDKDSTYYLQETKAPEGYNLLDAEQPVNLGSATVIDVQNNKGTVLPSTGGMGTTILYIVGGILVVGGVAALITKRRLASEK